jgi:hypothetical protein
LLGGTEMEIQEVENVVRLANVPDQETNINNSLASNSSLGEQRGSTAEQQEQYLNKLFGRCFEGYIEIRTFSKDWSVTDRQWHPVKATDIKNLPINEHVFIGVATRHYEKGGKADIVEIPAVWTDVDFKKDFGENETKKIIDGFSLKPSMIVRSGNGLHLYWSLETPAQLGDIQKIEDVNRRLAKHFQGDRSAAEAARILRLPETYNIKYDPPFLVNISSINDKTYHIEDFDFLPAIEPPEPPKSLSLGNLEEWHTQILRGVSKGERHTSAVRLAGRYQYKGLTEYEVQILMAQWNERNQPPLSGYELSKTITDIFNRNKRNDDNNVDGSSSQDFTSVIKSSIMRVHDFMHKALPVKPYIINPLLKKGELIMISAARGVGKTWFALSLGFMATRKSKIGNWETKTPTATWYIDGEMSEDEMQDRLFKLEMGRQSEAAPFYLLSSDEMRSNDRKSPNLNNPAWRSGISDYLKSHPDIGLVILDNLASLTPGRDENKKRDWDDINEWLLELRSKGVAVIFLHHEGKGGEQRGTSAIEDNINFSIRLKRPQGYQTGDGAKFIVEFTKSRRLYGNDAKPFTLQLLENAAVLVWEVMADDETKTEDQIIDMWHEGAKQKDIAKTLGVTPSWVSQVLNKVKEEEKEKRFKLVSRDDKEQTEDYPHTEEVEVVHHQN